MYNLIFRVFSAYDDAIFSVKKTRT